MTKAEAYEFLLKHCKNEYWREQWAIDCNSLHANTAQRDIWQACIDLLEAECPFHLKMLEGRE